MEKRKQTYVGPETGRLYDFSKGDKIDPVAEGIGCTEDKGSPCATIDGQRKYRRIFVRLRTPQETLTCSPIRDGVDFAQRCAIIEGWFNSVMRAGNYLLTFEACPISDEDAELLEKGG